MMDKRLEEQLTAYALGETDGLNVAEIEALIARDEDAQRLVGEIQAIGELSAEAFAGEALGDERREAVLAHADVSSTDEVRQIWRKPASSGLLGLAAAVVLVLGLVFVRARLVENDRSRIAQEQLRIGDALVELPKGDKDVAGEHNAADSLAVGATLANQELRFYQVQGLLEQGDFYLENEQYDRAIELYEESLVVDPANEEATRKLAEATLGAYDENVAEMGRDLTVQTRFIRRSIEENVLLPDRGGDNVPLRPTIGVAETEQSAQLDALGVDAAETSEMQVAASRPTQVINRDGTTSIVPFYTRPDEGTIENSVSEQLVGRAGGGIGGGGFGGGGRGGQGGLAGGGGGFGGVGGIGGDANQTGEAATAGTDFYTGVPAEEIEQLQALGYLDDTTQVLASALPELTQGIELEAVSNGNPAPQVQRGRVPSLADVPVIGYYFRGREIDSQNADQLARLGAPVSPLQLRLSPEHNTEAYDRVVDNPFKRAIDEPLSTFSIDVDTGSYANVRRFLRNGQLPPKDAVRIEELLNYFDYEYAPPANLDPFAAHVELVECPWNDTHQLMRIGLKGREVEVHTRPRANLVFLLDVSGSMDSANKLPLVQDAMQILANQIRPDDRVAIVTYAGNSGLALPSTLGSEKRTIRRAIAGLRPGGSTNGAAGIELAYQVAQEHYVDGGVNRVILATDGDFNVGVTDRGSLDRLIKEKAKSGVFLTVLGVGEGNLKDATMEQLANKGNGQYAYLDSEREARKVLADQVNGTLVTIAKDVKIQIDFNPARVGAYRLIGYENRVLAAWDFDDDTKDAGEIGAGHAVTALYEIVPPGVAVDAPSGTRSRYQAAAAPAVDTQSNELLTVKLRYKQPDGNTSTLLEIPITAEAKPMMEASRDTRFAASVAAFGMALRESPYRGTTDWDLIANLAEDGLGDDTHGYRNEFMSLVRTARGLKPTIALNASSSRAADSGGIELVRILKFRDGYVAEIRTDAERPKRFGVGEGFESFKVVEIRPNSDEVIIYSEEHRRNFTLLPQPNRDAEAYYNQGIDEYDQGMYRLALNNFTRALALDPEMDNARDMIKKTEERIELQSLKNR